jgi:hypothetical protein
MLSARLYMNDRLETGRQLKRVYLSRDGFLRSGVTTECLKKCGKFPVDRERLIILVMMGTRIDAQSLNKEVGMGSSAHCLFGRDCNNTSDSDVGLKTMMIEVGKVGHHG